MPRVGCGYTRPPGPGLAPDGIRFVTNMTERFSRPACPSCRSRPVRTRLLGCLRWSLACWLQGQRVLTGVPSQCTPSRHAASSRAAALARGELDRAAGQFSLALEYEPAWRRPRTALVWSPSLSRPHHGQATLLAALALDEDLAEAHLNLGGILLAEGAAEEALERFRRRWRSIQVTAPPVSRGRGPAPPGTGRGRALGAGEGV